jgi:hypothetical protein
LLHINVGIAAGEALFGEFFGFAGALHVDFVRALGGLGKDGDFVGQNFGKSPGYSEALLLASRSVCDFADR